MADTALPALPTTVALDGASAPIEGDPLEFMRTKAREHIDSVEKNKIVDETSLKEFKTFVLTKLKDNITKFEELDKADQAKKDEEAKAKTGKEEEFKDPFADIFKDESKPDETAQQKGQIAGQFATEIKSYKETFIKRLLKEHESKAQEADVKKLDDILNRLNTI